GDEAFGVRVDAGDPAALALFESGAGLQRLGQGRLDVVDRVADVVDALAEAADVLGEAAVGVGRLAELVLDVADHEVRLAGAGLRRLADLGAGPEPEHLLVVLERGVGVSDGEGDVLDAGDHIPSLITQVPPLAADALGELEGVEAAAGDAAA